MSDISKQITLIFQINDRQFAIPQQLVLEVLPFQSDLHSIAGPNLEAGDETLPIVPLPAEISLNSFSHNFILIIKGETKKCLIVDLIVGVREMNINAGENVFIELENQVNQSKNLLLVESDIRMLKLLANSIEDSGYHVDKAKNITVANKFLKAKESYQAILIGTTSDKEKWINFAQNIKDQENHHNSILIALSGDEYLKPFDKSISKIQYKQIIETLQAI